MNDFRLDTRQVDKRFDGWQKESQVKTESGMPRGSTSSSRGSFGKMVWCDQSLAIELGAFRRPSIRTTGGTVGSGEFNRTTYVGVVGADRKRFNRR
ncbi:MAG: hypothetical protein VYE64_10005 [Planctomycetota bacterium]|nr:hypothetical protein [Planctomycetota bacterium]